MYVNPKSVKFHVYISERKVWHASMINYGSFSIAIHKRVTKSNTKHFGSVYMNNQEYSFKAGTLENLAIKINSFITNN